MSRHIFVYVCGGTGEGGGVLMAFKERAALSRENHLECRLNHPIGWGTWPR